MLVRQSLIYSMGSIIPGAIAALLLMLYTRLLTPEEFGLYALVMAAIEFTWSLSLSWLSTAMVRLFPAQNNIPRFLGSILSFFVAISLIVFVCVFALIFFIDDNRLQTLAILGVLLFIATGWMELNSSLFMARLDARRSAVIRITRSVGAGLFAAAFVVAGAGAEGILIGATLGMLLPGISQIYRDWRHAEGVGRFRDSEDLVKIGRPLAGGIAVGSVGAYAGQAIVTVLEGVAAFGFYAVGAEMAERLVMAILGPLSTAAAPLATHDLEKSGPEAATERLANACILMIGIMAPATVGLILVTPDIVTVLIGEEFQEMTLVLLPLATIATMLFAFRAGYMDQSFHLGMKQNFLFWREVVYLFVTVLNAFLLVSAFGVVGLGYAAVATTTIMLVVTHLFSRHAFTLPYPKAEIGKIILATIVMGAIVFVLPVEAGWTGLIVKPLIGVSAYAAVVLLLDVSGTRELVSGLLRSRLAA